MKQNDHVALTGMDSYRDLFTVLLTQHIETIDDPHALMVYVKLCTGKIKDCDLTIEQMAEICNQSYARFIKSLQILARLGYIKINKQKVANRTHDLCKIDLVTPFADLAITQIQQPLFDEPKQEKKMCDKISAQPVTKNKKTTKSTGTGTQKEIVTNPEWGTNPQIAVIDFWNELQGVKFDSNDPIHQEAYKREVRNAKIIAKNRTHNDIRGVWQGYLTGHAYNTSNPNRPRVDIFYLFRQLTGTKIKTQGNYHVDITTTDTTPFDKLFS